MRYRQGQLMKTPSAKSRFFPAGKEPLEKLHQTCHKVHVGPATPPSAQRRRGRLVS